MRKKIVLKNTSRSLGIALLIFCIIGIIFDQIYKGTFTLENYSFTKMALGAVGIGLGFGLPTIVYEKEDMSLAVQTLIHMGVGSIVMTIVAFAVGWIPSEEGPFVVVITILGELAVAFGIWFIFYLHMKKLAGKVNQKLKKME
ncbi:DUF3021 domain-containing protein [Lachnoclostridium sp. Marseille-P6806]|uniref:DUF3021 domain-containing protein n=1 Tax=Lachnoclostridium sp. Marseille-P6806 TaxID=2364793 RepID=UPI0013EF05C2|nr:DUF3021 domain-containing protein [Lachnoclostridium sp. Marseille-P6806]